MKQNGVHSVTDTDQVRGRSRERTTQQLRSALERLQKTDPSPTIAAVAREAGVTAALIHNKYPDIAKEVRRLAGKPATRDEAVATALKAEMAKSRELREESNDLRNRMRALASVNESLRQELNLLKAMDYLFFREFKSWTHQNRRKPASIWALRLVTPELTGHY